jgi:hypothetical protein
MSDQFWQAAEDLPQILTRIETTPIAAFDEDINDGVASKYLITSNEP